MTAVVKVEQTVQKWGNDLRVRMTAPVAKPAQFSRGLPVTVEVVEGGVFARVSGRPKQTLAQKLEAFDPKLYNGEAMLMTPIAKRCRVIWFKGTTHCCKR